eukprot:6746711-Prymnesium_polylepis.2
MKYRVDERLERLPCGAALAVALPRHEDGRRLLGAATPKHSSDLVLLAEKGHLTRDKAPTWCSEMARRRVSANSQCARESTLAAIASCRMCGCQVHHYSNYPRSGYERRKGDRVRGVRREAACQGAKG